MIEKISETSFDAHCPLLLHEGLNITGNYNGQLLITRDGLNVTALFILICGQCCHNRNGCNPKMEDGDKESITAELDN